MTWDVLGVANVYGFCERTCICNGCILIVREANQSIAVASHLSYSPYIVHFSWEEVMTLIHDVNAALEMTAISVNDESILNIVVAVFWLPDCVECFTIKLVNLTSLAWSDFIATDLGYPLNNGMTVWVG